MKRDTRRLHAGFRHRVAADIGHRSIRRRLLVALGGGLLAPTIRAAQPQPARVHRIGFLGLPTAAGWTVPAEAFRAALRDLGYVEGRNIVVEIRWAEGKYERLPELAAELVRTKADVIVTHTTAGTLAVKQATSTIPIVMAATGDAVASGLVTSLARPGGNITGSSFLSPEIAAKRIELLVETVPRVKRIAVIYNQALRVAPSFEAMTVRAKLLGLELHEFSVRFSQDVGHAFAEMRKERIDAVTVMEDPTIISNAGEIANHSAKHRLPTIGFTQIAENGGLIGYGASIVEMHRRAAYFVDRILKGAKPAELPVEQPTKYDLVINIKTAKALGVSVPQSILLRADKVIE